MQPLGKTQQAVLQHLQQRGQWWPHIGWCWDTISGTERIMKSLEKRGLVKRLCTGPENKVASYKYVLTVAGKNVDISE